MIPLHYSAIADANGFEPLLIVLETIVLPVTLSIHTRATGLEPTLQESKSCVLTICTTPYYLIRKSEEFAFNRQSGGLLVSNSGRAMLEPDRSEARPRTRDRLLIRQEF